MTGITLIQAIDIAWREYGIGTILAHVIYETINSQKNRTVTEAEFRRLCQKELEG